MRTRKTSGGHAVHVGVDATAAVVGAGPNPVKPRHAVTNTPTHTDVAGQEALARRAVIPTPP